MTKLAALIGFPLVALLALGQSAVELSDGKQPHATGAMKEASPELAAIKKAALDYCDGWYTGDASRMERALHADLAKRVLMPDPNRGGKGRIEHMSALTLVQYTREGYGKKTSPSEQRRDVRVLDVYGNAASVRLDMHDWIDYMHLSKIDGEWKIVNVLWEMHPEAKKRRGIPEDL